MFEITELAKKFSDDSDMQNVFNNFVSNTSEVTGLDKEVIKKLEKLLVVNLVVRDFIIFSVQHIILTPLAIF